MFRGGIEHYELRCSTCGRVFDPSELGSARAHQNFKPGHRIVVYHNHDGGLGPLDNFTRIKG